MSNETANAIRKVVVGTIVAEYGLMQIRDNSKQELKQKTNFAINAPATK